MNYSLRQLRIFITVAQAKSFSRAGDRIGLSQSAVSHSVKELERQTGVRLLDRTTREVVLTEAGQQLATRLERVLDELNSILRDAGRVGTQLTGTMRVAASQTISAHLIFMVAVPEDHDLASRDSVPLAALRNEYFVTLPSVHSDWGFLQRVCQQAGFSPMIIREVVEPQTVLAMISMGIGITLMADGYAQMSWPGVVFRPLEERIPADLYIVYDQQQATPALEKLVAALTV